MRNIPRVRGRDAHRVRRWDVIVLGSALPGWITAIRLGQSGARVLIVEERSAAEAPAILREPFVLTGADANGMLGSCLRGLGLPLIDQRRFLPEDVALQVVLPDARIDFGRAPLTAAELTAWGIVKPEEARELVRALESAAMAERTAMEEPLRAPRARLRGGEWTSGNRVHHARGWPQVASELDDRLGSTFAAIARALSHLGRSRPSPEARARLVGGLLGGAFNLPGQPQLRGMLRRRAESVFTEVRALDRTFEWVSVAGHPGIALEDPEEMLVGRVLVLNAPLPGLRRATRGSVPESLKGPEPGGVRVVRHLRGAADVIPTGMERRVVCVPARGADAPVVTLRREAAGPGVVDLIASAVGPADAPQEGMIEWIDRVIAHLAPFSQDRVEALPVAEALWDTDTIVCDPERGGGWPATPGTRRSHKPAIHHLDRASVGALGFEGDLLLGLQAADAIAGELP